jgi:putative ABC transport system permease protein
VTGESVTHGDAYSIQVLIGITAVIFLLALANFIVLSMMTLPGRSKEFAIKKVAGATGGSLVMTLMVEYLLINLVSFLLAVALLALVFPWIESGIHIDLRTLVFRHYLMLIEMMLLVILANAVLPLTIAFRFTRPAPGKLLGADTLTFPVLKKWITTIQLGICFGLLISTFIIRKQVSRSLLKEPGRNHDQVVVVRYPRALTDTKYNSMKKEFQALHPNVVGIIAVSHLLGDIQHKALHAENFTLYADRDLASFFRLRVISGHWFTDYDPSINYLVNETMQQRKIKIARGTQIGVLENFNRRFNQPEKPVLITLGSSQEFNFILVRVYEVDIRKTIGFLSRYFGQFGSEYATVHFMDKRFDRWIRYEDQLSAISGLLVTVSVVITCLAAYSLSLSQARDKTKTIAIHKMFGATISHVALLLTRSMLSLQLLALTIFLPVTYLLMQEWLRHFVYAAHLEILDVLIAFGFDLAIIVLTCSAQASRLNRVRLTDAVKA